MTDVAKQPPGQNFESEVQAPDAARPDPRGEDAIGFNPFVLIVFVAVFLAVCWQNWVLARRAELDERVGRARDDTDGETPATEDPGPASSA